MEEHGQASSPANLNGDKAAMIDRFHAFAAYHTRHMIVDENELRALLRPMPASLAGVLPLRASA
jgi:hypothetical protein